jgi:two-component system response regulator YesN
VYRVIIVEDSDWIRKGLEFTIPWAEHGFAVVGSAANGLEDLDLIRRLKPDLALVDIKMPLLGGLEMIERFRTEEGGGGDGGQGGGTGAGPEFIVISGYGDFAFTRKAILLGARDYLLKPVVEEELVQALDRMALSLARGDSAQRLEQLFRHQSFDPAFVAFFHLLMDESVRKDDLAGYAMRRMEERFDSDLGLGDVAAELGVSESTLGKRFKKVTGSTFVEYATMVRIRKALEMLADPACRVNEVAARVGMADSRYFSSLFKRYTGFTPSEFRKIAEGEGAEESGSQDGSGA